jgi:hypothetical protein
MNARAVKTAVRALKRRVRDAATVLQVPAPRPIPEPIPVLVEERRRC